MARGLTGLALAIPVVVALWATLAPYGWLEVALGEFAPLFWLMALAWLSSVVCVVRWRKRWWLLITAPVMLYPAAFSVMMVVSVWFGGDGL